MNIVKEYIQLLLLFYLTLGVLPETSSGRKITKRQASDRKKECPKVRFFRRGCSYRYECKEECKEKKDCRTTYQYKCKIQKTGV